MNSCTRCGAHLEVVCFNEPMPDAIVGSDAAILCTACKASYTDLQRAFLGRQPITIGAVGGDDALPFGSAEVKRALASAYRFGALDAARWPNTLTSVEVDALRSLGGARNAVYFLKELVEGSFGADDEPDMGEGILKEAIDHVLQVERQNLHRRVGT